MESITRAQALRGRTCIVLLLVVMAFIAAAPLEAGAYTRPTTEPPTDADLLMIGGKARTVVVRLLNLTPYAMVQDLNGITAVGSLDKNRNAHKSFLYAPVGWPSDIPGLQGTWGQQEGTATWVFTPCGPSNTTLPCTATANQAIHPYSFVVAWDDQGGYVTNSSMGWTIKNVYTATHGPATKDVPLRLWFTRVKPKGTLFSEIFKVVSAAIVEFVDVIGVAIDPANPIAWLDIFAATKELKSTSFEYANSRDTGGEKMYAAAYTIPDSASCGANCLPSIITHSTSGESTDAVDVQWGSGTGEYSSNIVITTHLLRGLDVSGASFNGSVPILSIVVWTPDEYRWAEATSNLSPLKANPQGARINTLLRTHKLRGLTQFAQLHKSLTPSQSRSYGEIVNRLYRHQALTPQPTGSS